ncbi:MAG: hypothetical protein R3346_01200 [Candidatus Spechtbacterales bacterium]|nr:hypothetical protein [Candidatus Spechtbacterales bacterium]
MKKDIKKILKELYSIDPDLALHEKELEGLIAEFLNKRPEIKPDSYFIDNLRSELLKKSADSASVDLNYDKTQKNIINNKNNIMKNIFGNAKVLSVVGSALAIIAIIVAGFTLTSDDNKLVSDQEVNSFERLQDGAFGDLAIVQEGEEGSVARGEFGGGGNQMESSMQEDSAISREGSGMIAPDHMYRRVEYSYTGDDFPLETKGDVYKRIKDATYIRPVLNNIEGLDTDNFSLRNLSNTTVRALDISEDIPFGYNVSIRPNEDSVTISANWDKWPRGEKSRCAAIDCIEPYMEDSNVEIPIKNGMQILTEKDIDKEKAISIVDKFIDRFNIDMSFYGEGEIRPMNFPAGHPPQNISILYPLNVNGLDVYEGGGNKSGVYAEVSMVHGRVTHFSNITSNNYAVSGYAIEQNKDRIIKMAERGGIFGARYMTLESGDSNSVELGTPEFALYKVNRYINNGSRDEFLVPALVFPIENVNPNRVYLYNRGGVVVPIVKEFLDVYDNDQPKPEPRPLPEPIDTMQSDTLENR